MIPDFRQIVTVQEGGLISLRNPSLPVGVRAEVSVHVEGQAKNPGRGGQVPSVPSSRFDPAVSPVRKPSHFVADPSEYLIPEVAQPPVEPPSEQEDEGLTQSKQRLLAALAESDIGTQELRVAYILQHYVDTRDDDIALLIRYYEEFQASVLENWTEPSLDILYDLDNAATILRLRRHIQNDLDLFVGTLRTRYRRKELTRQFYKYMKEKSDEDAEIRIFLDETKGDPGSRYLGVAGVCVIDWRQYEKYYAAIRQWRSERGWPQTLHVSNQAHDDISKHLALLGEVKNRRAGLLFVGHDVATRAVSHRALVDLFVQLVMGCLRHLSADGCLGTPRAVQVIKEAEDGFDRIHLETLSRELQQQISYEFPEAAYLKGITAVQKGREVFLELADMVAAGMQRRALYGGWKSKDALAEAVANVTGFEDSSARGVVYKAWYHHR